ncbi:MAG: hypothetical protein KJ070_17005 [Verrucomicrobia bacterium]|nr:hypothetical protein [Verrucomicrobiota bacterium]
MCPHRVGRAGERLARSQARVSPCLTAGTHGNFEPAKRPSEAVVIEVERDGEQAVGDTYVVAHQDRAYLNAAGFGGEEAELEILHAGDRHAAGVQLPLVGECGRLGEYICWL